MSLRARLILTLVVLAGVGLLVLGAATYAAQSAFEVNRIDQQASGAVGQAEREFERSGGNGRRAIAASRLCSSSSRAERSRILIDSASLPSTWLSSRWR